MRRILVSAIVALMLAIAAIAAVIALTPLQATQRVPIAVASSAAVCPVAAPLIVGSITVPAGPINGYCQDQLVNAARIIEAARSYGIGTHTQAIGVMTAMGESGLRNLAYGDAAGADSRGLFQQRANGAWGTLADRMEPYTAARNFFGALVKLPGWKSMTPTYAAHAVQVNQDPNYYARYWTDAVAVVAALGA